MAVAVLAAFLATTGAARARSAGIVALGCEGCHSGGKAPTVTLMVDPANPAVGEPITLTIGVSQANGPTAGFYLTTAFEAPGAFKALESGTAASSSQVMHTMPRTGSGGTTTFKAQWTATSATGVAFDLFALSANGDKRNQGDGAGAAHVELTVGCTGATYYLDQDGDGYGTTDPAYPTRRDCQQPAGYASKPGDCDDFRASIHPDAPEQCDMRDNDCNGKVDDDVIEQSYCEDQDGDGHGVMGGATKVDCKPSAGFGDCSGDCDDRDPMFFPGAVEICDSRDNDCDGQVDEGVRQPCGVGLCARFALGCGTQCTPGTPLPETCNGYDDDCDGLVDEDDNATLCGDARVPCVEGRCLGANGAGGSASSAAGASNASAGTAVLGSSAGSANAGSAPGLPSSPPPAGCAFRGPTTGGSWAAALWLLLVARRRNQRPRHSPAR